MSRFDALAAMTYSDLLNFTDWLLREQFWWEDELFVFYKSNQDWSLDAVAMPPAALEFMKQYRIQQLSTDAEALDAD